MTDFSELQAKLIERVQASDEPQAVLKAPELGELYAQIRTVEPSERAAFGQKVNALKQAVAQAVQARKDELAQVELAPIDVTAPMDANATLPSALPSSQGSIHPISAEITCISDIFYRMGYMVEESREIDDQFHMFDSLNFPANHPARDDYDTFMTVEKDSQGEPLVAPAHTSTMQYRVLKKYRQALLKRDESIAVIVPDRVFRNEDVDATHEHTFYQIEGVYVARRVTVGNLIATLKTFLEEYYGEELEVRTNPFYFPFTEPSFEFSLKRPGSDEWIELLGCGMIHPNVLRTADIDPETYSGFAFGCGIDRLAMMRHDIEDIRHFQSGKLEFLKQF